MKPIQNAFKAAASLVNEWRDTLSYTVMSAYTGSQLLHGHTSWIPIFISAASARELARDVAWLRHPFQPCLVGDNSTPVDYLKNSAAAAVVGSGLLFIFVSATATVFSNPGLLMGMPLNLMACLMDYRRLSRRGGTLRDIPNLYFHKETGMWDWPRKQGGGGTTQTQKTKDAISAFGKSLTIGAARPVPVSSRTRFSPRTP